MNSIVKQGKTVTLAVVRVSTVPRPPRFHLSFTVLGIAKAFDTESFCLIHPNLELEESLPRQNLPSFVNAI